MVNEVITWDDLPDLRAATDLPILLKGVLDPDDARRAREAGVNGVIVSNHGGRQVDGAIAALDALPDVAGEVGGELAVLFDSGIRGGADAAKALALGAEAILLGRPYLWGLVLGGADGVEHVLRMLLAELDLTMALCGASTPAELTPDLLRHAPALTSATWCSRLSAAVALAPDLRLRPLAAQVVADEQVRRAAGPTSRRRAATPRPSCSNSSSREMPRPRKWPSWVVSSTAAERPAVRRAPPRSPARRRRRRAPRRDPSTLVAVT